MAAGQGWAVESTAGAAAAVAPADALYRSVAVVTGTGEANRSAGFAQGLGEVLVKLTGDQTILEDRRLSALAAQSSAFVESFSYRDRLAGKPLRDEQGTYDRPHNLTVVFDPVKINALARSLGREPWLSPRPRVVVFLAVENLKSAFMLASDGVADRSEDMRAALTAAAEKVAIPVALPTVAQLDTFGVDAGALPDAALAEAQAIAGTDVLLAGRIVFSEAALGWVASWRMQHGRTLHAWGVRGVSFDDAFRNAMRGAAQVLSGHGAPK